MNQRSFLFLLASTRRDGNTEALARHAAASLPEGTPQRWLHLTDHPLPPFTDARHDGEGVYPAPEGDAKLLMDATLEATDVVIASPLYWYSVSAPAKLYLDHWSGWMRVPGTDFRARMAAKTFWGVTAVSHEDYTRAEPLIGTLRLSAEYFGARFGGVLLGLANRPGTMLADGDALDRARTFFTGGGPTYTRLASPRRTQLRLG
ncbi:MAG: NAD(P)H-dependent oxidoreductase [Hamadaea sp.]|nr:NAD(P)H-dependent oxidoreductase [Hamadaea sp.]